MTSVQEGLCSACNPNLGDPESRGQNPNLEEACLLVGTQNV